MLSLMSENIYSVVTIENIFSNAFFTVTMANLQNVLKSAVSHVLDLFELY